ncbi:hypothetical protein BASA83_010877 [Batrachochytrium salamandrivorans]|nr:hypothetical protein BASA83_010877 [Batrachochytrium salamandrivorans]
MMSDSDDFETLRVRVSSGTVRQTQQTQQTQQTRRTQQNQQNRRTRRLPAASARSGERPARPTSSQESIVNSQQPQVAHPQWVVHPQPTSLQVPTTRPSLHAPLACASEAAMVKGALDHPGLGCPVCGIPAGKIAAFMSLEEHVNQCLDSSVTAMDQSTLMHSIKEQNQESIRGFIQEQNQGSIQGSNQERNQGSNQGSNQEMIQESNPESIQESNPESNPESIQEMIQESNPESTQESNQESNPESNQESNQESIQEMIQESNQEMIQESNQEMIQETIQESNQGSNQEQHPVQLYSKKDLQASRSMPNHRPSSPLLDDLLFCPVCSVNLSSMSGTARERHTNKCLDEVAALDELYGIDADDALDRSCMSSSSLNQGSSKLMDLDSCMFCLQEWPSARTHPVRSRIAHTKICAKAKGISPHKILESLRSRLDLVPDTLDRSSALSFDCAFSGQTPSIASGQFLSAFRAVHSNVNRLTKKQKHANRVADKQDLELQTALALSASVKTHHDKQQRLMLQYGGCTVIPSSSSAGPGHRSKRVLVMSKLLAAEEAQMKMESRARAILHASTSSSLDTSQDPCSLKTAHHSLQFQSVSRDSWLETRTHGIRSSDSDEIQIDTPPAVGAEGPGSLLWYAARGNLPVRDIPLMASYKSRVDPNLCILDATATVSDECSNSVDISQPDLLSKSTPPKASLTAFHMEGVQKTPQKKHSEPVEPLTTNAALSISEHDSLCSNEEESELSLIMKAYNADIADKRREADVEKEAIEIAFQTWANLRKKEMESKVAWATRERLVSTKDKLPIRDPPIIGFKTHISLSVDSCTNTLVCSNNESSTENELDDIHLSFSHNTREIPMGIPADGSPSFATATDPCSGVLNNDNSVVEVLEMESPVFYSSAFLEWNGRSEPEFLPLSNSVASKEDPPTTSTLPYMHQNILDDMPSSDRTSIESNPRMRLLLEPHSISVESLPNLPDSNSHMDHSVLSSPLTQSCTNQNLKRQSTHAIISEPHTTSEPTDLIEICSTDTDDEIDDSLDATNSYVFVQPIKLDRIHPATVAH